MDRKEYIKQYNALNRAFIKANREVADGEIVFRSSQKVVVLRATGVNITSGVQIMYDVRRLKPNGELEEEVGKIYGFEKVVSTGEFYELEDDVL